MFGLKKKLDEARRVARAALVEKNKKKHEEATETAWRIHGALGEWTGKVDAKASFAFALESAGIATGIALSDESKLFSKLEGPGQDILYYGGMAALLVAAAFSV